MEDNHTPGSLLLQKNLESHPRHPDLLNLIPCEPNITTTPFCDTTIITYKI